MKEVLANAAQNVCHVFDQKHELFDIAQRALATATEDRFQSVIAFQSALRNWYQHGESQAMAQQATQLMQSAEGDIQKFSQAMFLFEQAMQLWQGNTQAEHGKAQVQALLFRALVARGALADAADLLHEDHPEYSELLKEYERARELQEVAQQAQLKLRDFEQQTHADWRAVVEHLRGQNSPWSKWRIHAKNIEESNDGLVFSGGSPALAWLSVPTDSDFRLTFRARLEGVKLSDLSCFFSAYPKEDCGEMLESGYQVKIGAYSNSMNLLLRTGNRLDVHSASPLRNRQWMDVHVERQGQNLIVLLNKQVILSSEDAPPLHGAGRSALGIFTWQSQMSIDRVRLEVRRRAQLETLLTVAQRQLQQGRFKTAIHLFEDLLAGDIDTDEQQAAERGLQQAIQRQSLRDALREAEQRIARFVGGGSVLIENDGLAIDLCNFHCENWYFLQDLPISHLRLINCGIQDISFVQGLPLRRLVINQNHIKDLSALVGMDLRFLHASHNHIDDLSALRGLPLQQ